MPAPKSVVKIDKNGVTYTSNVDACEFYMFELTRAALRDVAKFVRKEFRTQYYSHFEKHTGDAGRAVSAKIWSSSKTKYPRVDIGLKKGRVDGFYAFFQEFGAKGGAIPKLGILQNTVSQNVATIVEIESKYLSGLSDEAKALSMCGTEDDIDIEEDEE